MTTSGLCCRSLLRKRDKESGEVVGLEGEVDVEETVKALAEKACADEEHDGNREFEDDEVGAETTPESSGGAAIALVEGLAHGCRGKAENGRQREDDRREQSDNGGEDEDVRVETEAGEVGHAGEHVLGDEAEQKAHRESYQQRGQRKCRWRRGRVLR